MKYIEVTRKSDNKVIKRLDITQLSKDGQDLVKKGVLYDDESSFVRAIDSEAELETGTL